MILAHRVALNGIQLDEVDERIIIKGIDDGAGKDNISSAGTAEGCGMRITSRRRDTLDVTVSFSMNIRNSDMAGRTELFEKIGAWAAGGGWLTINYKPNRRLYVVCAQMPGAGDQWDRTSVYTITFRAYCLPYWEEETAVTASTGTGTGMNCTVQVNGSAETEPDVVIRNRSGMQINTVTVNAAGKRMYFENLGLMANEELEITHVMTERTRYLRIAIKATSGTRRSVMLKRTDASDDELTLKPGARTVSFTAQRACSMTVSVRGRFI